MNQRLSFAALGHLKAGAAGPAYDPRAHGVGIVHIGAGAFHRAHQAVYTDAALAEDGGDWRITGVSLRSTDLADALGSQDGLFTVVERSGAGDRARVIGSVARVLPASRDPRAVLDVLADPRVRIVTLTVTEKAYGIDRSAGDLDLGHPAIAADLQDPRRPQGTLGFLVEGLRLRRDAGLPPYAVLCCDNLPDNGALVRMGALAFARRVDPSLAEYISAEVAFPSSMVDRITPAATEDTRHLAAELTGFADAAAIETEPFSQWVIEDRFPQGRPAWQAWGAIFVDDVAPYERMKLRMLNGAHSMMAYTGFLTGRTYVRDVMADPALSRLVARHLKAAAASLPALPGLDLEAYATALSERFANPSIAHETYQIAMDGTEKLPQRIFSAAMDAAAAGQDLRPFAFTTAAWARYALGHKDDGTPYALRDPREDAIRARIAGSTDAGSILEGLFGLPGLIPTDLLRHPDWRDTVQSCLGSMLADGMAAAVQTEAARR